MAAVAVTIAAMTGSVLVCVVTAAFSALLVIQRRQVRAAKRALPPEELLIRRINALLPQTQCEQCGEPGCRPYATAVARGADCNRCAPGGEPVARAVAELLGRPPLPAALPTPPPRVARIRADVCIGCARCLPACPVDAISGANKFMHAVLEAECTGCGLCIPPCPVDCIDLVDLVDPADAAAARAGDVGQAEARRKAANAAIRHARRQQRNSAAAAAQAERRAARLAQRRIASTPQTP